MSVEIISLSDWKAKKEEEKIYYFVDNFLDMPAFKMISLNGNGTIIRVDTSIKSNNKD